MVFHHLPPFLRDETLHLLLLRQPLSTLTIFTPAILCNPAWTSTQTIFTSAAASSSCLHIDLSIQGNSNGRCCSLSVCWSNSKHDGKLPSFASDLSQKKWQNDQHSMQKWVDLVEKCMCLRKWNNYQNIIVNVNQIYARVLFISSDECGSCWNISTSIPTT